MDHPACFGCWVSGVCNYSQAAAAAAVQLRSWSTSRKPEGRNSWATHFGTERTNSQRGSRMWLDHRTTRLAHSFHARYYERLRTRKLRRKRICWDLSTPASVHKQPSMFTSTVTAQALSPFCNSELLNQSSLLQSDHSPPRNPGMPPGLTASGAETQAYHNCCALHLGMIPPE